MHIHDMSEESRTHRRLCSREATFDQSCLSSLKQSVSDRVLRTGAAC